MKENEIKYLKRMFSPTKSAKKNTLNVFINSPESSSS
jgi:hypothetical protein